MRLADQRVALLAQLEIQAVPQLGAKLGRALVQEQQAVLQPGQLTRRQRAGLRVGVGHLAADFGAAGQALELAHRQEMVGEGLVAPADAELSGVTRGGREGDGADRGALAIAGHRQQGLGAAVVEGSRGRCGSAQQHGDPA
ncbi:MAG: hypothetical protein J0M20_10025 [Burkholderiales bacterium]|nr:hypothetical protein [Burkholderiales bacterium]